MVSVRGSFVDELPDSEDECTPSEIKSVGTVNVTTFVGGFFPSSDLKPSAFKRPVKKNVTDLAIAIPIPTIETVAALHDIENKTEFNCLDGLDLDLLYKEVDSDADKVDSDADTEPEEKIESEEETETEPEEEINFAITVESEDGEQQKRLKLR